MIDARARLGVIMSLRVGRRTTSRNITPHAVPAQVRARAGRAKDMARPSSEVCVVSYCKEVKYTYQIGIRALPDTRYLGGLARSSTRSPDARS